MFGDTFGNDFLRLILTGASIAGLADNAASSPVTNLYVSLHTADPAGGDQTTGEATYTGYTRVAVARSGSSWTISGKSAENAEEILFPKCTGGSSECKWFAIGTVASGAGKVIGVGAVNLNVTENVTPRFQAGALTLELE